VLSSVGLLSAAPDSQRSFVEPSKPRDTNRGNALSGTRAEPLYPLKLTSYSLVWPWWRLVARSSTVMRFYFRTVRLPQATLAWLTAVLLTTMTSSATAQGPSQIANTPIDELFKLTTCNGTSDGISVMVLHRDLYDPDKTIMSGWKLVSPRQCEIVGLFPRAPTSVFARKNSGTYKWPSTGPHYCVSPRPTFRKVFPNEECIQGEGLEPFFQVYHGRPEETVQFKDAR